MVAVKRVRWRASTAALASVLLVSCSSAADDVARTRVARTSTPESSVASDDGETSADAQDAPPATDGATSTDTPEVDEVDEVDAVIVDAVSIDVTGPGREIDDRVFGVNVPAWLGPERFADPRFAERAQESGATLIRMPGGSWSNWYRWEACEQRDESGCYWLWASRPSDFIGFLRATELPGLWTVNVNESAQSAAALVAFFNGTVDDQTEIGVDRDGVDWGTIGRWADLRAEGGHPEPVGVQLWEVGNEVFGGRPEAGGDECASFGWEEVWTCDGREYVLGVDDHDGYLAIREAMLAVDPTIVVGAVGVSQPGEWSGWGDEVIEESGDALDFYVVHTYGFNSSPSGEDAVARAVDLWPSELGPISDRLGDTPLAITEYNLVSMESGDTERTMTTAMNALYLADSLGQLVEFDVPIGAMWTLASGTCWPDCEDGWAGTDYGLVRVEENWEPQPAFEAFRAWGSAGTHRTGAVIDGDLRFYPTRDATGRVAVVVVNTRDAVTVPLVVEGLDAVGPATLVGVTADSLDADRMSEFDGGALTIGSDNSVILDLPAHSISVLEIMP